MCCVASGLDFERLSSNPIEAIFRASASAKFLVCVPAALASTMFSRLIEEDSGKRWLSIIVIFLRSPGRYDDPESIRVVESLSILVVGAAAEKIIVCPPNVCAYLPCA